MHTLSVTTITRKKRFGTLACNHKLRGPKYIKRTLQTIAKNRGFSDEIIKKDDFCVPEKEYIRNFTCIFPGSNLKKTLTTTKNRTEKTSAIIA